MSKLLKLVWGRDTESNCDRRFLKTFLINMTKSYLYSVKQKCEYVTKRNKNLFTPTDKVIYLLKNKTVRCFSLKCHIDIRTERKRND